MEDNAWLGLLDPFGLLTADTPPAAPPAAPVTPVTLQASPAPSVDANRRRGFMTVYSNGCCGVRKMDAFDSFDFFDYAFSKLIC